MNFKLKSFIILFLFFVPTFSFSQIQDRSLSSSDTLIKKDCSIFSIIVQREFSNKKSLGFGQGWYFTGPNSDFLTNTKVDAPLHTENYILTPYHIITASESIKAQCPYSDQIWDLELVGSSPTYDLAVLKILDSKHKSNKFSSFNHTPLFKLNKKLEVSESFFPLGSKFHVASLNEGNISKGNSGAAFVFTSKFNNQRSLMWSSAGPMIEKNEKDPLSLAPFSNAITPYSGVQPGMSGGLLMTVNPKNELLGMIMGNKFNRGHSLVAPFNEIIQLLPSLLKKQDPHKLKNNGTQSFIKFISSFENDILNQSRYLYLPQLSTSSSSSELIAADPCISSQLTNDNLVGGATVGDMTGGASIGDSGGSLTWSKHFSIATYDWMEVKNFKRFHIRGIYQKEDLCKNEGVIWIPLSKTLIGINSSIFKMTINSIRDLIFIEEHYIRNKKYNPQNLPLKDWINTHGMFKEDQVNFENYIIRRYCNSNEKRISDISDGLLQGTNLLISMPNALADTFSPPRRIYEDYAPLHPYKEIPQGYANNIGPGYYCTNLNDSRNIENNLFIVGSNLKSTYESPRNSGNSYLVKIEFYPKFFNFQFDTYYKNGEDHTISPQLKHKSLKREKTPYINLLNHFFEIDGYKFYLRLTPEQKKVEVSLIGLPDDDPAARYLMASQGEVKMPLAGFNFVYTLENE